MGMRPARGMNLCEVGDMGIQGAGQVGVEGMRVEGSLGEAPHGEGAETVPGVREEESGVRKERREGTRIIKSGDLRLALHVMGLGLLAQTLTSVTEQGAAPIFYSAAAPKVFVEIKEKACYRFVVDGQCLDR